MSNPLHIDFEWLNPDSGNEIDRVCSAAISIAVRDQYLTRVEDLAGKSVRNHVRACAWQLASWFASNWWRLMWEPATPLWWKDTNWRIAHSMANAGGGFIWPSAVFASDGDSMEILLIPKRKSARTGPIHYINPVHEKITVAEFEEQVDSFIAAVLDRLETLKVRDKSLGHLWSEIIAERHDLESTERRKLEAMSGYDPDESPDGLIDMLLEDREHLGAKAVEEVAAEGRHQVGNMMQPIREFATPRKRVRSGGFRIAVPYLDSEHDDFTAKNIQPWQRASRLAKRARMEWGFDGKPIRNKALADLLSSDASVFTEACVETPIPFGVRQGRNGDVDLYLKTMHPASRRFAIARVVGDRLGFPHPERLIPATHTKTTRQKFQRAFAQEFLCPFDSLMEKLQTENPDDDAVNEAARYFHVSPRTVLSTLVNNGELGPDALTWTADSLSS
jgi:hypothetical protein